MKNKIPVIISVDTGIDDAVSIILALQNKKLDIKLFVCGHGNTTIENATQNTLGILDLVHAPNIPVVYGSIPSKKRQSIIFKAHGDNGLCGYNLSKSNREIVKKTAEDSIYSVACENENLYFINLGPSTSLAKTILKYPDVVSKIEKVIFMGGSINEKLDTTNPYTEFNVASDPESAEIIFKSGLNILMVPTEIGRTAKLDYYDIYRTKTLNHTGEILEKIFRNYRHRKVPNGVATCDSTALLTLTNPEIYKIKKTHGFIKYFDHLDTGVCLFDETKQPNMEVAYNIDINKFKKIYFKLLSKTP